MLLSQSHCRDCCVVVGACRDCCVVFEGSLYRLLCCCRVTVQTVVLLLGHCTDCCVVVEGSLYRLLCCC